MILGFTTAFQPLINSLGKLLENDKGFTDYTPEWKPIKHVRILCEEDYTVIPVYVRFPSGTVQTIEDGIMTECNHYGATYDLVESSTQYMSFGGLQEHDYSEQIYQCDHCPAWSYDQEDWNA